MSKRAWVELNKLQGLSLTGSSPVKFIIDSSPFGDEDSASSTSNTFIGRILPTSSPFNQSALKVEFKLPGKYPVDPPEVRVLTPIHHPNVLDDGSVCLPILRTEDSWRPSVFLDDVVKELVNIIDHPNLNVPVNDVVANEYLYKKNEYDRKALEKVQKNPVSRTLHQ